MSPRLTSLFGVVLTMAVLAVGFASFGFFFLCLRLWLGDMGPAG